MTATTTARPAAVMHQHDTSRTSMMRSDVERPCPTGSCTREPGCRNRNLPCLHEFSIGAFEREAAANGPNADRRRGSHGFGHDRRLRRRGRGVHPARNFLRLGWWPEPRERCPFLQDTGLGRQSDDAGGFWKILSIVSLSSSSAIGLRRRGCRLSREGSTSAP